MKYKKFRELKINIYSINFKKFSIKKVLNYMPAGNDVIEVQTDKDENYFIKIERSKVSDFKTECKNIINTKKKGYKKLPDIIEYIDNQPQILVLKKITGKRLNDIINDNNKEKYLYKYGKELSIIHSIDIKGYKTAKQRVINDIPFDNLYCKFDKFAEKTYEYLKKNNYEKSLDTFIHGDFHYANIIWYNRKISGVLDWEYSGIGNKEQDIAWALILRPNQKFMQSIDDIKAFLAGYQENGNYDEEKLKWCLINGYLHFYLMNNDKKYKEKIKKCIEMINNML